MVVVVVVMIGTQTNEQIDADNERIFGTGQWQRYMCVLSLLGFSVADSQNVPYNTSYLVYIYNIHYSTNHVWYNR